MTILLQGGRFKAIRACGNLAVARPDGLARHDYIALSSVPSDTRNASEESHARSGLSISNSRATAVVRGRRQFDAPMASAI